MPLSPRERVLTAMDFKEPDRVPLMIGVSNATGIKMKTCQGIRKLVGLPPAEEKYLYDWPELGTALLDEATLQRLHCDVRSVTDLEPESLRRQNHSRPEGSPYVNSWGVGSTQIDEDTWFPGIHPLADAAALEAIDTHSWPDMDDPGRVVHAAGAARALAENGRFAVLGVPWLMFPFERAIALQGLDAFLLNLAMAPDFAEALLRKTGSLCNQLTVNFLKQTGEYLDIIKIGDDLGTQESLMISPAMYRKLLKPIHADLIASIKEHTDAKVFFHSDGDIFNLIDDFIEIGVDILNPIQTSAGKMADLEELKRRFGGKIAFCGAVDTQRILPHGSPGSVRDEVKRVMQILGPGGGYMVSSVHSIMNDVPPENVLAMVDTVVEFGRYPLTD